MKTNALLLFLSIVFVFFGITLLKPSPPPLQIITSPNIYSIKQSFHKDRFVIPVLMNQNHTPYQTKDFISRIHLSNEEEVMSLELVDIYIGDVVQYNKKDFYITYFEVRPSYQISSSLLMFEEAYLQISYVDGIETNLYIGEFNYLVEEELDSTITISLYRASIEKADRTRISGIELGLVNRSEHPITITNIEFISTNVQLNKDYLQTVYKSFDLFEPVEDIILTEYHPNNYSLKDLSLQLRSNQEQLLYVPVSYTNQFDFIHKAIVLITYEQQEQTYQITIDDFPFISESIFQSNYEEGFILYEYHSN